jgi:hypothetical protein
MNDEPLNPGLNTDTMDTQLLQLERELFSLTPAEPPRFFNYKLTRRLDSPTQLSRDIAVQVTPFRWRRMVVPAAAAVVVVSGLNRLEGPVAATAANASQAGGQVPSQPTAAPLQKTPRFVLKTEPFFLNQPVWQGVENQHWIPSGSNLETRAGEPRRHPSAVVPVLFH